MWASKVGSVRRIVTQQFVLVAVAGLSWGWALGLHGGAASTHPPAPPAAARTAALRRQALRHYARLPLSFEPNLGQSAAQVKFLSRGQGYGLFLTADRAVLSIREPGAKPASSAQFHALSLKLLGGNPGAQIAASDRLPGTSNYLMGDNPRQWHTDVPHYARVHYRGIYPGIDLVYYGRQQQLEYDFVVSPGADPSRICLQVQGAQTLSVDGKGNLVLQLPGGAIQLHRPLVYQEIGNKKQLVAARYTVKSGNRVAFALAGYDRSRTLVIDPRLVYFSYLGGSLDETMPAVAVDAAFNAIVAGTTASVNDFPTTAGAFQTTTKSTTTTVFVTKFNSSATGLYFSTFLGGSGTDTAAGIAVDKSFNVYVTGTTNSGDFPVTPSAYQRSPKTPITQDHVFVTELNSSGNALVYSTYLSGSSVDTASGVALGPIASTVFVTGTTQSSDFANISRPTGLTGSSEFFVTKLNTSKQGTASLVYSTYVGGNTPASAPTVTDGGGIAVDPSGNAYITGGTNYTDMPAVNAPTFPNGKSGSTLNGIENAFVAKLNPNGAPTLFLTYLGGSGTDKGTGLATDSAGNAYVTGSTSSTDFPVLAPVGGTLYQGTPGGATDAFATKIASNGSSLIWSTYIGGSGADAGLGIAVDANQNSFVTGSTTSTDLMTVRPTQSVNTGGTDAFVAEFDVSATAQFVTYLGSNLTRGTGIALDPNANPYVAGETDSPGLAVGNPYQATVKGGIDAFVAHFAGSTTLGLTAAVSPASAIGIGNAAAFTFTITNTGQEIATAVIFTNTWSTNGTFQSATPSQGTCSTPAGFSLVCGLGQIVAGGSATVTLHISGTAAGSVTDTGTVSSGSTTINPSAGTSVLVNDFSVAVSPTTASTPAGQAATYTVTVSPVPQGAIFPNGISLKCSGGVPTAAMCAFNTNPVVPGATPKTSSLTITTTAPPPGTTTGFLFQRNLRQMYAVMLPLGGIAFLGFSLGENRRRKRLAAICVLGLLLALIVLQPACSSSSNKSTLPPFTPKGTYNITVAGVAGSGTATATRTTKLTLVVQ
ncbi:MAG TPA: SBBP repeat-containing protein [Terriglobales bacterium]|nr:SBBP repeat-containing protein [Terriglobales bacterium]